MPKMLIAANVGGKTRRENLDGEDHLVVPAGMLAVGVWPGSAGKALYRQRALANSVPTWDHKPVVVYHPKNKSGDMVTACKPKTLNKSRVGIILNTRYDDKLKCEAWLNIKKCNAVDPRIISRLEKNRKVETSTGIVYRMANGAGEFKGKKYDFEVRRIVGDHLAILPDEVGAYPVSAGGGLLANREFPERMRRRMGKTGAAMPDGSFPITTAQDLKNAVKAFGRAKDKAAAKAHIKKRAKALGLTAMLPPTWKGAVAANELSGSDISSGLRNALAAKYGRKGSYWSGYVSNIYPEAKYAIFYGEDGLCYKQDYATEGDAVSLTGSAVPVTPKMVYQTTGGDYIGNSNTRKGGNAMAEQKKFDARAHAKALIVNGAYRKEDFKKLLAVPEDILEKIPVPQKKKVVANTATADEAAAGTTTPEPKRSDWKELLGNAAPEDRAAIEYGRKRFAKDKEKYISEILANENNTIEEDYLRGVNDIDVLAGMAKLANSAKKEKAGPVDGDDDDDDGEATAGTDYSGAGGSAPVLGNEGEIEVLEAPDYDLAAAGRGEK